MPSLSCAIKIRCMFRRVKYSNGVGSRCGARCAFLIDMGAVCVCVCVRVEPCLIAIHALLQVIPRQQAST